MRDGGRVSSQAFGSRTEGECGRGARLRVQPGSPALKGSQLAAAAEQQEGGGRGHRHPLQGLGGRGRKARRVSELSSSCAPCLLAAHHSACRQQRARRSVPVTRRQPASAASCVQSPSCDGGNGLGGGVIQIVGGDEVHGCEGGGLWGTDALTWTYDDGVVGCSCQPGLGLPPRAAQGEATSRPCACAPSRLAALRSPEVLRISLPRSTLVPSSRTIRGTFTPTCSRVRGMRGCAFRQSDL